jgi:hypothetical protein
LPGPRGNIELAQAVADEGDLATFDRMIETDDEYLVFCGVIGLGRVLAEGTDVLSRLRGNAVDARWRVREAVAVAGERQESPPRAAAVRSMHQPGHQKLRSPPTVEGAGSGFLLSGCY